MDYDFDSVIDRYHTNCIKWDFTEQFFGEKDLLPMWIADMDFRSPPPVIDALKRVAERGVYGYSNFPESYYEAVIAWMQKRHGWDIKQEWFVFTPGVVPAIKMAIQAFTSPGDQVIVQTPDYPPFISAIKDNGRQLLDNPLRLKGNQYVMNLADLKRKLTPRARMIILCSPHNPVGRVWTRDELKQIGELCVLKNIIIVCDEIHEDIVYKGYTHLPFASISQEFADRAIVCTAASKTFNLAGIQTSNIIIANPEMRNRFREVARSNGVSVPNIFGLTATEAAYRHGEPWLEELLIYLQGNLAFLNEYLEKNIPEVKLVQPQGTYLVWLDFRHTGIKPSEVHQHLLKEARLCLDEGTIFLAPEAGFERMNIACPRAILEEGLRRVEKVVKPHRA